MVFTTVLFKISQLYQHFMMIELLDINSAQKRKEKKILVCPFIKSTTGIVFITNIILPLLIKVIGYRFLNIIDNCKYKTVITEHTIE